MSQAMYKAAEAPKVHFLYAQSSEREKIQAFAMAQHDLVTALQHIRANDGDLLGAMANTRRALDAIQDLRQLIN